MQQQDKVEEKQKQMFKRGASQAMKELDIVMKNKDSEILMQIDVIRELKQQLEV